MEVSFIGRGQVITAFRTVVVPVYEGLKPGKDFASQAGGGGALMIERMAQGTGFTGKKGEILNTSYPGEYRQHIFVGLGEDSAFGQETVDDVAAALLDVLAGHSQPAIVSADATADMMLPDSIIGTMLAVAFAKAQNPGKVTIEVDRPEQARELFDIAMGNPAP